jgi:hypothetical protein
MYSPPLLQHTRRSVCHSNHAAAWQTATSASLLRCRNRHHRRARATSAKVAPMWEVPEVQLVLGSHMAWHLWWMRHMAALSKNTWLSAYWPA